MYELQQVRFFLKVAECGSLKKAAEELNMTQPGLSRSMHRLEEELEVPLFVRTSNTIDLNENGQRALDLFKSFYGKAIDIKEELQNFNSSKKIFKILSPSSSLFEEVKRRFSISNPEATIEMELSHYDEMLHALRNEECHLIQVVVPLEGDDVYNAVFEEESLYLLLPENHPLSSKKNGIMLSQLDGETVLAPLETGYWNDVTQKLLPNSHFIFQKERTDFKTLISASTLPTFVTDSMVAEYKNSCSRTIIPLLDEYLNVTVYCCCLKKNKAIFEKFFDLY